MQVDVKLNDKKCTYDLISLSLKMSMKNSKCKRIKESVLPYHTIYFILLLSLLTTFNQFSLNLTIIFGILFYRPQYSFHVIPIRCSVSVYKIYRDTVTQVTNLCLSFHQVFLTGGVNVSNLLSFS